MQPPDYTSLLGSQRHVFVYIDVRVRFMYVFVSRAVLKGAGFYLKCNFFFQALPALFFAATECVTLDKCGKKINRIKSVPALQLCFN